MNINNNLALSYMYKVLSGVYKILKQTNTSRLIYKNLRVNTEECGDVIMRGDVIQLYDVMRCMRSDVNRMSGSMAGLKCESGPGSLSGLPETGKHHLKNYKYPTYLRDNFRNLLS